VHTDSARAFLITPPPTSGSYRVSSASSSKPPSTRSKGVGVDGGWPRVERDATCRGGRSRRGIEPCSSRIRELVVYDTYRRRAVGSGLSWAIRGITRRVLHLITGTRPRRQVGDPMLTASVEGANDDGHDEMP
jgi:hypothetical protein